MSCSVFFNLMTCYWRRFKEREKNREVRVCVCLALEAHAHAMVFHRSQSGFHKLSLVFWNPVGSLPLTLSHRAGDNPLFTMSLLCTTDSCLNFFFFFSLSVSSTYSATRNLEQEKSCGSSWSILDSLPSLFDSYLSCFEQFQSKCFIKKDKWTVTETQCLAWSMINVCWHRIWILGVSHA